MGDVLYAVNHYGFGKSYSVSVENRTSKSIHVTLYTGGGRSTKAGYGDHPPAGCGAAYCY